jgi:hypothetical protein
MLDRNQTKHIHEKGTWQIPSNFHESVTPHTYESRSALTSATIAEEYHEVRFCFRDMLSTEDPVPRPEGDWPSEKLNNFLKLMVLGMIRDGHEKFQMAFPQLQEPVSQSGDWSEDLSIAPEFRNHDSIDELMHAGTLYREYNFQLTESQIPGSGKRISVSIRRANLPKKMSEVDFDDL